MKRQVGLGAIGIIIYGGSIFYISSVHGNSLPTLPLANKLVHLLLYFGFGLVFSYFLHSLKPDLSVIASGLISCLFIVLYGLSDEIHQMYVPGRHFGLIDLLYDTIGGIIGWLLFLLALNFGELWLRTEKKISD